MPASGFSQLYINKTKSQVKQELGNIFGKEKSMPATITETDRQHFSNEDQGQQCDRIQSHLPV